MCLNSCPGDMTFESGGLLSCDCFAVTNVFTNTCYYGSRQGSGPKKYYFFSFSVDIENHCCQLSTLRIVDEPSDWSLVLVNFILHLHVVGIETGHRVLFLCVLSLCVLLLYADGAFKSTFSTSQPAHLLNFYDKA